MVCECLAETIRGGREGVWMSVLMVPIKLLNLTYLPDARASIEWDERKRLSYVGFGTGPEPPIGVELFCVLAPDVFAPLH